MRTNYREAIFELCAAALMVVVALIAIGVLVRAAMEAMGVWLT